MTRTAIWGAAPEIGVPDYVRDFGLQIRYAAEAKGYDALDVGARIGISTNTLTSWVQGSYCPRRKTADRIIPLLVEHLDLDEEITWANWERARAMSSLRLFCKQDHPLVGGNLLIRRGHRRCRTCYYEDQRRWMKVTRQRARERMDSSDFPHGESGYNYGCRCDVCTEAARRGRSRRLGRSLFIKNNPTRITAFGETKSVSDWARDPRCVVGRSALSARLCAGWEPEQAITTGKRRALTPEEVQEIRQLREDTGMSFRELGKRFDASYGTIQAIVQRRHWPNVA